MWGPGRILSKFILSKTDITSLGNFPLGKRTKNVLCKNCFYLRLRITEKLQFVSGYSLENDKLKQQ